MSGVGKTSANDTGRELFPVGPHVADQLPIGTGEGLAEILFTSANGTRKQTRHNAFVYVDEGQIIGELRQRNGQTTMSVLRSIWSGSTFGNLNASEERRRIVPARSYVFGVVLGLQPEKVDILLGDVGTGTPQRFAWALGTDPTIPDEPPPWPGALSWEFHLKPSEPFLLVVHEDIAKELRSADLSRARGQTIVDPFDTHGGLLRLKMAGLLAILDGRVSLDLEDWHLAGILKTSSDEVRRHVIDSHQLTQSQIEEEATRKHVARSLATQDAVHMKDMESTIRRMMTMIADSPGIMVSQIRRDLSAKQRNTLDDALDALKDRDWIVEYCVPRRGSEARQLFPGPSFPT